MAIKDDWNKLLLTKVDPTTGSGLTWCPAVLTLGLAGVSISVRPNAANTTINGVFNIQTADFGADANNPPAAADWVTYPGSTNPATAGAVTTTLNWQLWALDSKWVRVIFTDTSSSSPLVDVCITGRTRP